MYLKSFLSVILLILSLSVFGQMPVAKNGTMDIREWDIENKRLPLNGEWTFYSNELTNRHDPSNSNYVSFPATWEKGQGYASYSLVLIAIKGQKKLSISIPQIYSSYSLYVDGTLIASNGQIGQTKESSVPQWLPQTVSFESSSDTIEIVLAVSNFYHYRGGVKDPLYLASSDLLYQHARTANVSILTEAVTLLILSLAFFMVFLAYGRKKMIIYFSLLCLSWSIRSVFSNQYLFIQYFPDFNWDVMVKIEYITLYMTMMWAILFLSRLFIREGNQLVKYILVTGNCIFTGFTLITPPLLFTQWLNVYLVFAGLLLVYGAIIVLQALVNERVGAWFLTISILLAIAIFAYDFSAFEGIFTYNPIVLSSGYILIFLMMSFALLYSLNIIKSKTKTPTMLRYDDFFKQEN